jgi:PAS domain-containing protein
MALSSDPAAEFFLGKFSNLEQLFGQAQFGVSIIDCDLRYIYVNDRMASINALPPKEHLGKTVREVDRAVALVVEPLLNRTIHEDQSFVDLEIRLSKPGDPQVRSWLICSADPMNSDGMSHTCSQLIPFQPRRVVLGVSGRLALSDGGTGGGWCFAEPESVVEAA